MIIIGILVILMIAGICAIAFAVWFKFIKHLVEDPWKGIPEEDRHKVCVSYHGIDAPHSYAQVRDMNGVHCGWYDTSTGTTWNLNRTAVVVPSHTNSK